MATATINNPQTQQFTYFASTMPFAATQKKNVVEQSEWDKTIADGAVTPQEFHAMFEKEIKNNW